MREYVLIKVSSKLVKLKLTNILYIEALADYIIINTSTDKYTILTTMKKVEAILSEENFCRVHNSYIVNMEHITVIEGNHLLLGKLQIPVSRNRMKTLTGRFRIIK